MSGKRELAISFSAVTLGISGSASWELVSCAPERGFGRDSCSLTCGMPSSLGTSSFSDCPQLSKVQKGSVGCATSDPFAAS
jgi:hypothetical protein